MTIRFQHCAECTICGHEVHPGRKAIDDNLLYVERLIAMRGDLPADKIKRNHVRAYRDMLAKFPRAQPERRRKDAEEIAAWAKRAPTFPSSPG